MEAVVSPNINKFYEATQRHVTKKNTTHGHNHDNLKYQAFLPRSSQGQSDDRVV
jgi:hypothetical protein